MFLMAKLLDKRAVQPVLGEHSVLSQLRTFRGGLHACSRERLLSPHNLCVLTFGSERQSP